MTNTAQNVPARKTLTSKLADAVNGTGLPSEITDQNWKEYIAKVGVIQASLQDIYQRVIVFSYKHQQQHGNFDAMNAILTLACSKYGKGIRSKTMVDYVKAVYNNTVKIEETKQGVLVSRKSKAKSKPITRNSNLIKSKWYNYDNKGVAKIQEVSVTAKLKQVQTLLSDLLENKKEKQVLAEGQQGTASEAIAMLESFLTSHSDQPDH